MLISGGVTEGVDPLNGNTVAGRHPRRTGKEGTEVAAEVKTGAAGAAGHVTAGEAGIGQ